MRPRAFHTASQEAIAQASRRMSLLALGMSVLAATTVRPGVTDAKKKGKDCKKKEKQRCSNDTAACKASAATICQQVPSELCAALQACCDQCTATGFAQCAIAVNLA